MIQEQTKDEVKEFLEPLQEKESPKGLVTSQTQKKLMTKHQILDAINEVKVENLSEMLDFLVTEIEDKVDFSQLHNVLFEGPVSRVTKTKKQYVERWGRLTLDSFSCYKDEWQAKSF